MKKRFSQTRMKIAMSKVMLTSGLSRQQNDVAIYFACSHISRHWEFFPQSLSAACSSNTCLFVKLEQEL